MPAENNKTAPKEKMDDTAGLNGPCPQCRRHTLVRKTRDAGSPYLGWVACTGPKCPYGDALKNYGTWEVRRRREAALARAGAQS